MPLFLLVLAVLTQAAPEVRSGARETAYARIPTAERIASDAQLVRAVQAKNQAAESTEEIRRRDEEWKQNARFPLRKELTQNECATRLRDLVSKDPFIVEAFFMDSRGGLVCSTVETQDYWQGDEAKWTKTYGAGGRVFVDEPSLDANTDTYSVQLSVLVSQAGQKIGALTLTLKVPKELVQK